VKEAGRHTLELDVAGSGVGAAAESLKSFWRLIDGAT